MQKFRIHHVLRFALVLPLLMLLGACTRSDDPSTVGKTAPDFTVQDAAGNDVSLSDFGGQPVLLFFHMAVG